MAGTESCRAIGRQYWPGVSGATSCRSALEERNQSDGKERSLIRNFPENCFESAVCVKSAIPNQVTADILIIPDHELLRVIGRGAYGEIWLARTVTGAFRAVSRLPQHVRKRTHVSPGIRRDVSLRAHLSRACRVYQHPARWTDHRLSLLQH